MASDYLVHLAHHDATFCMTLRSPGGLGAATSLIGLKRHVLSIWITDLPNMQMRVMARRTKRRPMARQKRRGPMIAVKGALTEAYWMASTSAAFFLVSIFQVGWVTLCFAH